MVIKSRTPCILFLFSNSHAQHSITEALSYPFFKINQYTIHTFLHVLLRSKITSQNFQSLSAMVLSASSRCREPPNPSICPSAFPLCTDNGTTFSELPSGEVLVTRSPVPHVTWYIHILIIPTDERLWWEIYFILLFLNLYIVFVTSFLLCFLGH